MNVFVYDDILNKYQKRVKNIETYLNSLGMIGKIMYSSKPSFKDTLNEEINNGARNIIIVGNNSTFDFTINSIELDREKSEKITFGIIPVGDNNSIAEAVGVENDKDACNLILSRRVEKINVFKANNQYFLEEALIKTTGTIIKIDSLEINSTEKGDIRVINLSRENIGREIFDPQDKTLNILIKISKKYSFLKAKRLILENTEQLLTLDNSMQIKTPAEINYAGFDISIVVGKNRYFNIK